ncbi:hypothetical protein AB1Y20_021997 [Prymnesium parvum]
MSGGQPPLRDVSMPLSLLSTDAASPSTHAAPTRFPAKPPPPSQIPPAPAPAPARQPARVPSCRPPKAQVAHVSRIALSSASSARALARARRVAETGEKSVAPELGTSARSSSGSVCRPAAAETRPLPASEQSEELHAAAPPEPAAAPPCDACQAKARALRKKEAEVTSLLHELSRSDRQWRDMVALLEGQLGEARQRVLHLEAQIRRGTGISWAPPPGEVWVDEDDRYMFAAGPAMAMKGRDEFLPWAPAPGDVWRDEDERFPCPAGPAGAVKGREERLPWAPPPREVWGDEDERTRGSVAQLVLRAVCKGAMNMLELLRRRKSYCPLRRGMGSMRLSLHALELSRHRREHRHLSVSLPRSACTLTTARRVAD